MIPLGDGFPFRLPTDRTTWVWVAAIVATGYVYVKARRRSAKKPKADAVPYANFGANLSAQKRAENQMTELVVELEKMARQITSQLDTRAARLEELIRQADERAALLKSMTPGPRFAEGVEPADDPEESLPPAPAPIPIDPRHAAVYLLADQGRSPTEIAKEVGQPAGEVELILALRRRAR